MVQKYHPIYMNTHFNHPSELTPAAVAALDRLADAGVPLGCQTVLLAGVNDDPKVMKELMHEAAQGARAAVLHLHGRPGRGRRALPHDGRRRVSRSSRRCAAGRRASPCRTSCIDAPGGGGKVPLLPEYVEEINEDEVIFRNYEGKRFVYKQPQADERAERGAGDRRGSERRRADRGWEDGEEGTRCTTEEVSERLIDHRATSRSGPRRVLHAPEALADRSERLGRDGVGV